MKATDTPELSSAWWKKEQPSTLPPTGLGKALKAYEDAREKAQPTKDHTKVRDVLAAYKTAAIALEDLRVAAVKAVDKCNSVTHKVCITVLKKYDGVIEKEKTLLDSEKKQVGALLSDAADTCAAEMEKVLSALIGGIKKVEAKVIELRRFESDAQDALADAGKAVASNEPNAGELEATIVDTHLKDAQKAFKELSTLVDTYRKDTLRDRGKVFDIELSGLYRSVSSKYDKIEENLASLDVAIQEGQSCIEQIEQARETINALADQSGDQETHFASILVNLNKRVFKILEQVEAQFREAGGALDNCKFNILNYTDSTQPGYQERKVLDEAKILLTNGTTLTNLGTKAYKAAREDFTRTLQGMPKFANAKNAKFTSVFQDLANTQKFLLKIDLEANKLTEAVLKRVNDYKQTVSEDAKKEKAEVD